MTPWERIGDNNKAKVRKTQMERDRDREGAATTPSVIGEQGRWLAAGPAKRATLPPGWWDPSPASDEFRL